MLALLRGVAGLGGVQFVWRGDVDDFDSGVRTKLFYRPIRFAAKIFRKCVLRVLARVCARDEFDARMAHEGRQHEAEGATKTDSTEAEFSFGHFRSIMGSDNTGVGLEHEPGWGWNKTYLYCWRAYASAQSISTALSTRR